MQSRAFARDRDATLCTPSCFPPVKRAIAGCTLAIFCRFAYAGGPEQENDMRYTVHWTAPSGASAEPHALGVRAAERAMTFASMGASDVYVETPDGRVFRAPAQMAALIEHAQTADAARG